MYVSEITLQIAVPGMMELHYRGKGHVKRVKGWMYANKGQHNLSVDEIERIGQHDMVMPDNPLENKAQAKDSELVEEMDISYCRVCNIPISSAVVAKQHYSGKKHQKALLQRLPSLYIFLTKNPFPPPPLPLIFYMISLPLQCLMLCLHSTVPTATSFAVFTALFTSRSMLVIFSPPSFLPSSK